MSLRNRLASHTKANNLTTTGKDIATALPLLSRLAESDSDLERTVTALRFINIHLKNKLKSDQDKGKEDQ